MCLLTCNAHASGTAHERAQGLRAVEGRDGKGVSASATFSCSVADAARYPSVGSVAPSARRSEQPG
jgi:hypothetical protein